MKTIMSTIINPRNYKLCYPVFIMYNDEFIVESIEYKGFELNYEKEIWSQAQRRISEELRLRIQKWQRQQKEIGQWEVLG